MSIFIATLSRWLVAVLVPILFTFVNPAPVGAGFFSIIANLFSGNSTTSLTDTSIASSNPQTIPLLQSTTNYSSSDAVGGGDITVVNNEALMSENGPSGTLADISDSTETGQISKYTVRKGDTLSGVAKMFGVSSNTITWANSLNSKTLKEGQVLVILPVSGIVHTVAKGDTVKSIAKKYKGDATEISRTMV